MKLDIYDDRYRPIGVEEKEVVHRNGLWHRTFSALAVDPARRVVWLQKKSAGRYDFDRPDHADVTVGGHYHAGESLRDGIREVREELGLEVDYADLHPLGIRQTAVTLSPTYVENEFQHWHLIPIDLPLTDVPFGDTEVSGLVELGIDDALNLAEGTHEQAPALYAIRTADGVRYDEGTLARDELVPSYLKTDLLFPRLFIAAERYSTGTRRRLFW
ncbi:NUDIX domain-containing protein [Streptomyces sp. AV19]|uniref:NUDIX hydrolase n=1 Tax=Streptomyces sp. AV19 TaxID=2793068 RepID=UPI0018FE9520|nr:NUDIX domain-containing protein [Streptomyces sp. AV19]MBH1939214.1 NUDIX domain-containing protein [Streptomyces sp. AV19]MDG4537204.1 NUDIX domain-containing protein [Streptomyces sp. AV19]